MKSKPEFIKNLNEVEKELHYLDKPAEDYRSRRRLAKATGAERIGVNYCYLRPGQVSSKFHYHTREEEFFLLLSGHARLRCGKETYQLGPGDAVSMKPGGPAHQIHNDFDEECIYLAIGIRDPEDESVCPDDGIIRKGKITKPIE
ncbi:MAG: cupin domain-containing protein [Candidatus Neomarinimicrobiota bacterium]